MKYPLIIMFLLVTHLTHAQLNPYEKINRTLDSPVEVQGEEELNEKIEISSFSDSYRLTLNMPDKHNLDINFKNFEKLISAVYPDSLISGESIVEILESSIPKEYKPVFEQ